MLRHSDLHGLLLLRDCLEADGAFMLLHAMKLAAMGQPAADLVLVAARHGAAHYVAAGRKAGLALPALQSQGRLAVVDVLASLAVAPLEPRAPGVPLVSLRALAESITDAAAGLQVDSGAERPLCLLVDDLSALACASGDSGRWLPFLHSLRSLGARLQRPAFCLVALAHRDVDADRPWLDRLEQAAATVVDIEPLESGRSAEVTGRVAVRRREPAPAHALHADASGSAEALAPPGQQVCYYRLSDAGGASFFPQLLRC
eukprot:scaffold7.g3394.t1